MGEQFPGHRNHYGGRRMAAGGAENFQQCLRYFLQCSKFVSNETSDSNMRAPNLVLAPGAIYPRYPPGRSKFRGAKGPPKASWRPRLRTWGLLKANALYWRKYLWHCWDFTAHPTVIRCPQQWYGAPIVIRRPGNCAPVAPSRVTILVSCRSTPESRTALQGRNEGGKGSTIPRAPNQYGGRRKSQQYHKCFLQCNAFDSERPQIRTWGRQSCFLPRAPSNLATPRLHWQHAWNWFLAVQASWIVRQL